MVPCSGLCTTGGPGGALCAPRPALLFRTAGGGENIRLRGVVVLAPLISFIFPCSASCLHLLRQRARHGLGHGHDSFKATSTASTGLSNKSFQIASATDNYHITCNSEKAYTFCAAKYTKGGVLKIALRDQDRYCQLVNSNNTKDANLVTCNRKTTVPPTWFTLIPKVNRKNVAHHSAQQHTTPCSSFRSIA